MFRVIFVLIVLCFILCESYLLQENKQNQNEEVLKDDRRKRSESPVIVSTSNGDILGEAINGFEVFKGIPYAESPTGNMRWKPPKPKAPWAPDVLNATQFGNCCPQRGRGNNEDCLNLNIYRPKTNSKEQNSPLPVLLWIYGGAFLSGCSLQSIFYGDFISNSTATILVSFNYRVGALGFLASKEISGNFGFLDQILAFQWVQKNIAAFGGDPTLVTIFGQSGAISVAAHLTNPFSYQNNYFQSAIVESDPITLGFRDKAQMIPYSDIFADLLLCDPSDLQCLYDATVDEILLVEDFVFTIPFPLVKGTKGLPWEPVIDGQIIIGQPLELFQSGKFAHVAIILGNVKNETTGFEHAAAVLLGLTFIESWQYQLMVESFFQDQALAVFSHYPVPPPGENATPTLIDLSSDYLFLCPTRNISMSISAAGVPTYLYQFLHSSHQDPLNNITMCTDGTVCHSAELIYVFHSLGFFNNFQFSAAEYALSWTMLDLWTSFAASHVPTTKSSPNWPPFNSSHLGSLIFDTPILPTFGYKKAACDLWDSLGY